MLINRPTQVVMAEFEELSGQPEVMRPGLAPLQAKGVPVNFVTIPAVTHFEIYVNTYVDAQGRTVTSNAFETGANAAADWLHRHLTSDQAVRPAPGDPAPPRRP